MRVGQPGNFAFGNKSGVPAIAPLLITSSAEFDAIDWAKPNQNIQLQRGLVLRNKQITSTPANTTVDAFGTGNLPAIINSTVVATSWTNVLGNVWSTSLAAAPSKVFERTAYTLAGLSTLRVTTGVQTAPGVGEFGWALGSLYIYSTTDPNLKNIEYATLNTTPIWNITSNGFVVKNQGMFCSTHNGVTFAAGVNGSSALFNDVYGGCNDGIDGALVGATPKNITVSYNKIRDSGFGPFGAGATGDGISFHGQDYSVTCIGNDIRNCNKSGIGNQSPGNTLAMFNFIVDCYDGLAVYGAGSDGLTSALHQFFYNIIQHTANQNYGFDSSGAASIVSPVRIEICNNVLQGALTTGKRGIFITNSANMTFKIVNNILCGWTQGVGDATGTANIEQIDYNDLFGNTLNYYDNNTGILVAKVGAHSLTSDPKFTNAAAGDFSLQAGSPCLNAGANVGLTTDFAGNPVPFGSAPDIGAYERQS